MRMADEVMFEGDVLQQPTIPVVNETNMKKKATMKRAIIARPISTKRKLFAFFSQMLQFGYILTTIALFVDSTTGI